MSLTRQFFNEFRPLFRLLEEPFSHPSTSLAPRNLNASSQIFQSMFNGGIRPAIDLSEDGNKYVIEAELPGVKKENIEVRVGDGGRSITIQGRATVLQEGDEQPTLSETAVEKATDESRAISSERSFVGSSSFTRTIWLPRPVDGNNVSGKLVDGVLTLQVPKAEDKDAVRVNIE